MRSGSDDDVKRVESVCRNGRMLERRSGGRLTEGDFMARFERVARDKRVTFSLREDLMISVIGGIMSYLLKKNIVNLAMLTRSFYSCSP